MKPIVAAFDFDGTLSRGVSGLRFFRQILGPVAYGQFWLRRLPSLIAYGLRARHEVHLEKINRYIFARREAAQIEAAGRDFAQHELPRRLLAGPYQTLLAHRDRGDRCVIVSRGYEVYLRPWGSSLGIKDIIATRLAADPDGILTGDMPEPSCDGSEKVRRMHRLLPDRDAVELHAYGDGPGDHALFRDADRAFVRRGRSFQPWTSAASR
jgi:phosphatidylglycerophosphatase C